MVRSEGSTGDAAVQAFLRSVCPAMESLAPVFVHHGFLGDTQLRNLAKLPKDEQLEFFRCDLGLNALQARVIWFALHNLKDSDC
ncbi:uncharacterized protein PHACADRAFT_166770 [Phanerochaete carnosa HHB-10118-sp]|uniref:Uncharacterized protein n=1 Tax=Phanerochaete carnosa (strain HHB-10118-sp) TaxID=650164 RepID=K5VTS7_PHACS|nr:uncharacterized protein PHACADRAFT_166770 [Phanerochaete carnosa HHB-10118-sp]EKM50200.1 hypothetical protein PHACADRAFT_166770 [Phanerochaete carnosa HHB-10118-sp]